MIELLTKICAKITIIVVENRLPHYFINVKKCRYPYSLIRCWLQLLTPMSGLVTIRYTYVGKRNFAVMQKIAGNLKKVKFQVLVDTCSRYV